LLKYCDSITKNNKALEQKKPQEVAAAIIIHFFSRLGFKIDKGSKKEFSGVSDATISGIIKLIDIDHNETET